MESVIKIVVVKRNIFVTFPLFPPKQEGMDEMDFPDDMDEFVTLDELDNKAEEEESMGEDLSNLKREAVI